MPVAEAFDRAVKLHREGNLPEVERLCREILLTEPDEPNSLNLLGTVYRQQDNPLAAVPLAEKAVRERPGSAFFHFNLGDCYRQLGRLDEAIGAYERSIAIKPMPQTYRALGHACMRLNRTAGAIEAFVESKRLDPENITTYQKLFQCYMRCGRVAEAAGVCRESIAIRPTDPAFHFALGEALGALGRWDAAEEAFRAAALLRPAEVAPHLALADALKRSGKSSDAAQAARRALMIDPSNVPAHVELAHALMESGRLTEAAGEFARTAELDPGNLHAMSMLAHIEFQRLNHPAGMTLLRRALELSGDSPRAASQALMCGNYSSDVPEHEFFEEHRGWGLRVSRSTPLRELTIDREPNRPLRVGYVSPDFRGHSVARFFEPVLAAHDRSSFETVLFNDTQFADATTSRLRRLTAVWHDTRPLNHTQLGDLIQRESIDILVDLSGHTADNRLPVFASRPAPVQMTYLGYPNTTGLPREIMACRLTDATCDPPGTADELHTEALVRLPGCFLCYKAPAETPAVAPPPADKNGYVTFGCFNAAPKCSPALFAWWAEILLRVPESRLVLKNTAMDDPRIGRDIRDRFGALGVKGERLILLGPQRSVVEHLDEYARVDVALDTYPYNGTTTTCESLWMGVPVVTLAGPSHRSRVGASVLGSVGLHRLIGESPQHYVESATTLASEAETRAVLRRTLRRSMSASALMDDRTFVRNLESAYRAVWRERCREEVR